MSLPFSELPSEVWLHVFGYLSTEHKSSVRATCKYFMTLVDHWSLWIDWTAVLNFRRGSYSRGFWRTLRRRRVSKVVMRSSRVKDWKQLSESLPDLTSVMVEMTSQSSLRHLKNFERLKRLTVRSVGSAHFFDSSVVSEPLQLTHLSVCNVNVQSASAEDFMSTVSRFKRLTSLVCHEVLFCEKTWIISAVLASLPELKHLSLSAGRMSGPLFRGPTSDPGSQRAEYPHLRSLELVHCVDHSLPHGLMKLVPGLNSLAVFYSPWCGRARESKLKSWLLDLPQLSNLAVVNGPRVRTFAISIPATVTSLTLRVPKLAYYPEDLTAVSMLVPNLLHLHIDLWPSHLGSHTGKIPRLFPKLRSLKLRLQCVAKEKLLELRRLKHLEDLEILDFSRWPLHLDELQAVFQNRFQVTFPRRRDVLACHCVS